MSDRDQGRDTLCQEIKEAFARADVGAIAQNHPGMPYAFVTAYINHNSGWHSMGRGWQRQACVLLPGTGVEAEVYMSGLYRLPEGKGGGDVEIETLPLLFKLPLETPGWAGDIVSRIRQASQARTEIIAVKPVQPPPPPIALRELATLGDLIDAHERHYFTVHYHAWLKQVLTRLGKVRHRGEEWFVDLAGHLCHSETSPTSAPITGPDGEPVVYTNAAYVRLAPFRHLAEGQG